MIENDRVLAIVPARAGSKGVAFKNRRLAAGRPLIAYTLDAARGSSYIDQVVVSSDDPEIIRIAIENGASAPFRRPDHLATDTTPSIDVIFHTLETLEDDFDMLVLLQPTSPLRIAGDIDNCIELCKQNRHSSVSVSLLHKSPFWMYWLAENRLQPILPKAEQVTRRQDSNDACALNGAVYCIYVDILKVEKTLVSTATSAWVMPDNRSLDIDTEADFENFEQILARRDSN